MPCTLDKSLKALKTGVRHTMVSEAALRSRRRHHILMALLKKPGRSSRPSTLAGSRIFAHRACPSPIQGQTRPGILSGGRCHSGGKEKQSDDPEDTRQTSPTKVASFSSSYRVVGDRDGENGDSEYKEFDGEQEAEAGGKRREKKGIVTCRAKQWPTTKVDFVDVLFALT
ncbi:hypothetical protein DFH11DRAFT_159973 [Phellopilus nigrolimitatus]|nr:hypothetical protein DFH11DRAFT_159973 [Phellopilus nigrolimitatus]